MKPHLATARQLRRRNPLGYHVRMPFPAHFTCFTSARF